MLLQDQNKQIYQAKNNVADFVKKTYFDDKVEIFSK